MGESCRRINRNIVECKGASSRDIPLFAMVLIETLWNVKNIVARWAFSHNSVLIETLWNVKQKEWKNSCSRSGVLIETLWNVKLNGV